MNHLLEIGERVLADSTHIFDEHDNAAEAEQLLAMTLSVTPEELNEADVPSSRARERYLSLVTRRAAGEPFPMLMGKIEFYGLDLKVKPGVFVPRPSSELTVERATKKLRRRKAAVVVDVCAGTGPIALAIADELPDAEVWALDIQREGLDLGRENANRLGLDNVKFRKGDMYGPLPRKLLGNVDLITAHVPYVPSGELDDLPSEVREHEPLFTLTDSSIDGLGLMRRAIDEGRPWLRPGGWLLLEMSEDMISKARKLCSRAGFEIQGVASDDDDLSLVIEARLQG